MSICADRRSTCSRMKTILDILHTVHKAVYSFYPILFIKTIYIFHKFACAFLCTGKNGLLIVCSRVSSEIFSFLDRKGRISRSPSTRKQLCKRGHLHEGMSSFFFPVRWRTTPWRFFYGNRNPPVFRRFAHRVPAVLTLPFFFGDANLGQVVAVLCAQDAAPPPVFPELAEPAVGRTST